MLSASGVPVKERQYFKQKPTAEEVRALAALLPGGPGEIVSTRSRRYAELGLAGKVLSEEALIALLAEEPGLWRRPIVIQGDTVVIGFDQKRLDQLRS